MLLELALALAAVSPLLQPPGPKPAPETRVCSIPLLQTLPPEKPSPSMKIVPPAPHVRMHMRQVTPPAPPCKK